MTITTDKISQLQERIAKAKHIVITAHKSPDGDSIGSSVGLFHYIKQKNKQVYICHPDVAPHFLHWIPGYDVIQNFDEHESEVQAHFKQADLIFCLDYNSSGRIGKMEKLMKESTAFKVMIDHHRDPDLDFCELMFSDITACSTSQLVCEIIEASGDDKLITSDLGEALYTGIVTDTGSFRFSSTLPKTHRIVANLLEKGVSNAKVHESIFDTNSLDRIKLVSFTLLEKLVVLKDLEVAYLSLSLDELEKYKATKGDTEGLVNQALAIQGVKMAVFFKEDDGIVKISFRSKNTIPVNELANTHFGGGGHLNAAGGKFIGNLAGAIEKFVTILPSFVDDNSVHFE